MFQSKPVMLMRSLILCLIISKFRKEEKMKLKTIILTINLLNCIVFSAKAADTTITVRGVVTQRTCEVLSRNLTINLGELIASDLSSPGQSSDYKPISLELVRCDNARNVQATFSGTTDEDDSLSYKNTGTAGGLKIQLARAYDLAKISPNTKHLFSVSGGRASIALKVRAVSKGVVTPGTISSEITVTYAYF